MCLCLAMAAMSIVLVSPNGQKKGRAVKACCVLFYMCVYLCNIYMRVHSGLA